MHTEKHTNYCVIGDMNYLVLYKSQKNKNAVFLLLHHHWALNPSKSSSIKHKDQIFLHRIPPLNYPKTLSFQKKLSPPHHPPPPAPPKQYYYAPQNQNQPSNPFKPPNSTKTIYKKNMHSIWSAPLCVSACFSEGGAVKAEEEEEKRRMRNED